MITPNFSLSARYLIRLLLATALLVAPVSADVTFNLKPEGIQIEATGLGTSVLGYPTLNAKPGGIEHKATETKITGQKAVIQYDGGTQITIDSSENGQIRLILANPSEDVASYQMKMLVGFGEGPNRKWKIGTTGGVFPALKPEKPHLFQGHAQNFTITNYENRNLTFTAPEFSYQQLYDAREWGWNAFFWEVMAPVLENVREATFSVTEGDATQIKPVTLIDSFGQSTQSDWQGKVKSAEELKADVESESAYFQSLKPPVTDNYGGMPGSGKKLGLKASGFFHVEKKDGRWILVNPEGNAFFHLGVCVFGPGDDYTTIAGRKHIYEWLPTTDGEFKSVFRPDNGDTVVSFHLANQIRKYNEPYSIEAYSKRMIERTKKWGFNSIGAFSSAAGTTAARNASYPYVTSLPLQPWDSGLQEIPGIHGVWDPFDESNRQKIEATFAKTLPASANDPLLIGYFLTNEPLFEDIPKVVPKLSGDSSAKRRLVTMLAEKYGNIAAFNTAWEASAPNFESLNDNTLVVRTRAASQDMQAYTGLFLESYFQLVTDTFHKYDKNHLLIGNRLQTGTINSEQLCRLMGKYLDVISFNYYTYGFDTAFLNRLHSWTGDKPMMLTEFYWSSPTDSGMQSRQDVSNQQERGLAYRNYVEQAAATDYIVGIEWFTLVDQATTGRWFSGFNGEAGNTGLISVADRPWKPMLAEMMKTNYGIYDVWLGKKQPFVWDDPRFSLKSGGRKTLSVSHATGNIAIDGAANNWPGVPAETIPGNRVVQGTPLEGFDGSFKLCWDETNLYVLANVKDGTPMKNKQQAESLWNGDGLELFLGAEQLDTGGPLLFTDRQILLGAGQSGQAHVGNSAEQYPVRTAVLPAVDGKGYALEAAIPWLALGVTPKANTELLFDLALDDGAGQERQRQLMWNGGAKNSTDRTNWGRIKLVP